MNPTSNLLLPYPDQPAPPLITLDPCNLAVVDVTRALAPTIKGEDLWNAEGTPKVDGRDRIHVEDPFRKTVDVVSVDEFLKDPRFDCYGSPERRKELVGNALWKTPMGMRSGLPIASSLKGRIQELQKAYQSREEARIRAQQSLETDRCGKQA